MTTSRLTCGCPRFFAVPIQPAALELLVALAPVLTKWGRWYVFGAQAVILYGVPRLSADVDVTLALGSQATESFTNEMQAAGFVLTVPDRDFVRRTRVLPFIHTATGMPVDVVLAGSGLEDEFLRRARPTDIGGVSMPVIDADDLVIAKVLAGRPKDFGDARALLKLRADKTDTARIVATLELLEEALGQSDLVAAFERLKPER